MAQINKPNLHFNTKLYTGNAGTQSITGVGFQPDLTWIKRRNTTGGNMWTDAVRGVTKTIISNETSAEQTFANGLTAFGTDGFTVGSEGGFNSANTIASWNWKAGGGQGSANTDGSINTTYTSANTTAGFSISQYTGTGSAATIGHGLGVKPSMIIVKNLSSSSYGWYVYHKSIAATHEILLNSSSAKDTTSQWNDTEPTSSVFSVGTAAATNGSGNNLVAYCFAEKNGYSKFGKYTGNGNSTNGPFVYTGFKPAWVLIKKSSASGNDWYVWDNKRDIDNPGFQTIYANESDAEFYSSYGDFLSNGFKTRSASGGINGSGVEYIYMAFAEEPLVGSNNIPATAR